jgi:hypothetical protein
MPNARTTSATDAGRTAVMSQKSTMIAFASGVSVISRQVGRRPAPTVIRVMS